MKKRLILLSISLFILDGLIAQIKKDWQSDREWVQAKYGTWGGAEVDPQPGPMI